MKIRNHIPKGLPVALLATFLAATSALHADSTQNKLPFPMPEFQTPAQLVKWRAETTAKTVAKEAAQAASSRLSTVDSSTFSLNSGVPTPLAPPQGSGAARSSQSNQLPPVAGFYTGKPYLAESGSYAFKYREYNPETARWTTIDPSGFPDGANNRLNVKNRVTSTVDDDGLMSLSIDGMSFSFNNGTLSAAQDFGPTTYNGTQSDETISVTVSGTGTGTVSGMPAGVGLSGGGAVSETLTYTIKPMYHGVLSLSASYSPKQNVVTFSVNPITWE